MTRRFALLAALVLVLVGGYLAFGPDSDSSDDPGPQEDPLRTVFVGDSITAGVSPETTMPDDTYSWVPYAVDDERSPWELDATVAMFGMTLAQMALGFESQVLALEPEAVVIMGGTNDALQRLPVAESVEWLESMVTSAQDAGIQVWVVAPPPLDPAYERDLASLVEAEAELADEFDVPFVDVRAELRDSAGNWAPGLSIDGVHLSEKGARRFADAILTAVTG